jgi:hypothetical protein
MAESVFEFVAGFNWDDDLAPIAEIVADPTTDFATALMIYWRLDGPWMNSDSSCNAVARSLNSAVRSNLVSGFYRKSAQTYDPAFDNSLTKVQVVQLLKAGTPHILIDAV